MKQTKQNELKGKKKGEGYQAFYVQKQPGPKREPAGQEKD